MNQICPVAGRGDLQIDTEGTQGGIRSGQLRQIRMSGDARPRPIRTGFARTVECLHPQVVNQSAQDLGQFEDVDTSSAVNVRRIFAGKQIDAHDVVLPTVATRMTHRI